MGVEKLAGHLGHAGQGVYPAVGGVSCNGATGGRGVDTDLMGASGVELEFEKAGAGPGRDDFPVGLCGAAAAADGHALAGDGMAADRALPCAGIAPGTSDDKGEVGFFGFPFAELAAEFPVGGVVFGGDEQTGGFAVKPMDDSGSVGCASGGESAFAMMQEGGREGSGRAAGSGMDVHAGGLVDHEDVLVLMEDIEGKILGRDIPGSGGGDPDGDGGFGGELIAGVDGFSVEKDAVLLHPLLDARAGFAA